MLVREKSNIDRDLDGDPPLPTKLLRIVRTWAMAKRNILTLRFHDHDPLQTHFVKESVSSSVQRSVWSQS